MIFDSAIFDQRIFDCGLWLDADDDAATWTRIGVAGRGGFDPDDFDSSFDTGEWVIASAVETLWRIA